jgi:glycosyltransferase involved in cell wall biosynthesis
MQIWYVQDGEPIPGIDEAQRAWRGSQLCAALTARGHRVTWWTATFDHVGKRFRRDRSSTVLLQPGLTVRLLHGPGYVSSTGPRRLLHQRAIARSFAAEARSAPPPDLLIAGMPTLELAEQTVLQARRLDRPVLIDVRDAWPDQYLTLAPPALQPLLRIALHGEFARLQRLLTGADGISAVSQTYLDWALARSGRPARESDGVFPLGSAPAPLSERRLAQLRTELRQRYRLTEQQPVAVFAGGCNSSIDVSGLFAALPQIAAEFPDLRIVIAGDGDRLALWQQQARRLPQVIFTGRLDRDRLAALLSLSTLGLAPYRSGTLISLPNKPFEYFAAGLPVINSLPGELPALLTEHDVGRSCAADDAAGWTAALRELLADDGLRAAMAERARRLAIRRFHADHIAAQLAEHLERLAAGYRGSPRRAAARSLDAPRGAAD